jgi:hypothetical protein
MVIDSIWQKTEQRWHDDMASHFDSQHWAPLLSESRAYLRTLSESMELLSAAERDTNF